MFLKSVFIAGSDRHITKAVKGTTKSVAYLTENCKTFCKDSLSFLASNLEKAGNMTVVIGRAKKVIRKVHSYTAVTNNSIIRHIMYG